MTVLKWLERLSLDAVIVALLWAGAVGMLAGHTLRTGDWLVLTLATWLTYVADRLRDAGPGREAPQTDRHRFHERHRRRISLVWLALFAFAFLVAVILLPVWKLLWGWILVVAIVAYLWFLGQDLSQSKRLLLKRIFVPLVFTAGVGWMAEGWRTREGLLALAVLLVAAFCNVLLISYQENRDRALPDWLPKVLGYGLLALLGTGNLALVLHWPVGVAALFCVAVYFLLYVKIKVRSASMVRLWADAALADTAILILLLILVTR